MVASANDVCMHASDLVPWSGLERQLEFQWQGCLGLQHPLIQQQALHFYVMGHEPPLRKCMAQNRHV